MATINVQRIVSNSLATYFEGQIPGLVGKIGVGWAGPEVKAPCLALRIIPAKMRFHPSDWDEVHAASPDDGKVIANVGHFDGILQFQLYTTSQAERELYEQKILDVFLSQPWSPGTIILATPALTVGGYVSTHTTEFSATLDSDLWREELSFEAKRMSFLEIDLDFPALCVAAAPDLVTLQNALSSLDQPEPTSTAQLDPGDWVEIQDDGTTEPAA